MEIPLDHIDLQYMGRMDRSNPKKPEFVFPASLLKFRFFGKKAVLTVSNRNSYWDNYVGVIVDGVQKSISIQKRGETKIILLVENFDREHEILFFKRMDSCHEVVLERLELSDGSRLLPSPSLPKRKIEVYGDSVSAGEVSEAVDFVGMEDPEHQGEYSNSWYSYGWLLARRLQAQVHLIAQGGIALEDDVGWFLAPNSMGMESVWDKVHYHPDFGQQTGWEFSAYIPQVVIVALGQNDSHPEDFMARNYSGSRAKEWRKKYKHFLEMLRKCYPATWIICCTTLINHHPSWDAAIDQVCRETADSRISYYRFRRNGRGTPGHLRISEAEEMAEELAIYIRGLEIDGW